MILSRWLLLDDHHDVPFESNATLRVHARHSGSPHLTAFHTAGWDASPTSDLASSKSLCSCVAVYSSTPGHNGCSCLQKVLLKVGEYRPTLSSGTCREKRRVPSSSSDRGLLTAGQLGLGYQELFHPPLTIGRSAD